MPHDPRPKTYLPRALRFGILAQVMIWLINGLYCKVLMQVPRHEAIVARILGETHAEIFTQLIGLGEILFSVWIPSLIRPRIAMLLQIILVAGMNILEAGLAPDLLLFGWGNAALASVYIVLLAIMFRLFQRPPGPIISR